MTTADAVAVVEPEEERRRRLILIATILGSSMAFVDGSVVNIALPTIGRDLHAGLALQQWVALSYSLAVASLYIVAGSLGDRYGRWRLFVIGVAGVAPGVPLSGGPPPPPGAVTGRGVEGGGGGGRAPQQPWRRRGAHRARNRR